MASYKLRLERKKKFKDMVVGYKFITSFYWEWIKSKIIPEKLFHHTIIDNINSSLENESKEVRYYLYTGTNLYESLEDSYEFYKKSYPNVQHINYCEDWYVINMLHVKRYFDKFDDIEFFEYNNEMCSYFSIKIKF